MLEFIRQNPFLVVAYGVMAVAAIVDVFAIKTIKQQFIKDKFSRKDFRLISLNLMCSGLAGILAVVSVATLSWSIESVVPAIAGMLLASVCAAIYILFERILHHGETLEKKND